MNKSNDLRELSLDEIDAVSGGVKNIETQAWRLVMHGMMDGILGAQEEGARCVNIAGDVPKPCTPSSPP